MKRILLVLVVVGLLWVPVVVFAAGEAVVCKYYKTFTDGSVEIEWDILSDAAAGDLDWEYDSFKDSVGNTLTLSSQFWTAYFGKHRPMIAYRIWIIHDTGGTAPDDAYDVYLRPTSTSGADLLGGYGVNLATATAEYIDSPVTAGNGFVQVITEPPVLVASGMGNANGTTIRILFVPVNAE